MLRPRRRRTMGTKHAKKLRKRKCKCCDREFTPQPHNAFRRKGREHDIPHQEYCTRKLCQEASKRRSDLRFRQKNPGYHQRKKKEAVARVNKHRAARRGRKSRKLRRLRIATLWVLLSDGQLRFLLRLEDKRSGVLQDFIISQPVVVASLVVRFERVLQGFFRVSQESWYFWHRFAENLTRPSPKKGSERKKRCRKRTQTKKSGKSAHRRKHQPQCGKQHSSH
jgi:hypothetical protein